MTTTNAVHVVYRWLRPHFSPADALRMAREHIAMYGVRAVQAPIIAVSL